MLPRTLFSVWASENVHSPLPNAGGHPFRVGLVLEQVSHSLCDALPVDTLLLQGLGTAPLILRAHTHEA